MIDLALNAGIPLVCALLAALWVSTRAWQAGYARARQRRLHPGRR